MLLDSVQISSLLTNVWMSINAYARPDSKISGSRRIGSPGFWLGSSRLLFTRPNPWSILFGKSSDQKCCLGMKETPPESQSQQRWTRTADFWPIITGGMKRTTWIPTSPYGQREFRKLSILTTHELST